TIAAAMFLAAPANAQTSGKVAIGANISRAIPTNSEGHGLPHYGLLWRIGQGRDGWGLAYGLNWYSTHLDSTIADQHLELGELHVRPVMGGYGYSRKFGSARVKASLLGGPAFASFALKDSAEDAYRTSGATSLETHMSNTWAIKPE